jgi:predicted nucleic acid-binding protein
MMSAVGWYEFSRGPCTPEQLSAARLFFFDDGIIPFSEELARIAGAVSRGLGSPRWRAADVAIGITSAAMGATLLTWNANDFAGIPKLQLEAVS